uniref:Uncharacterized protein n=1 Tax=Anguilla anguilla TaxID=7936 RepID=A0A0E9XUK6_ANGAN
MVVSTTPVGAAPSSSSPRPRNALTKVDLPEPDSPVMAIFRSTWSSCSQ